MSGVKRKCPYAGKVFPVMIKFPHNYPFKCPEMHFKPGLLYHPNVHKETGAWGCECTNNFAVMRAGCGNVRRGPLCPTGSDRAECAPITVIRRLRYYS